MDLGAKLKEIGGSWASYAALGSFALYLLGYLALRFRLTFLGIGTDLAVLDERYFYEGAKFVVYLVSTIPILLLIVLALSACGWVPYGLLPSRLRTRVRAALRRRGQRLSSSPVRLSLVGIVLSIVMIQFVMRQPFHYSNLLVAKELPDYGWLRALVLSEGEGLRSLYFTGLVATAAVTAAIALIVAGQAAPSGLARVFFGVLVAVVTIQLLFLSINYGFLITATPLPKVARLPGADTAPRDAWLAWEGKDGITYFVWDKANERRSLLTLQRKDAPRIEITGYDPVLRLLFASRGAAR